MGGKKGVKIEPNFEIKIEIEPSSYPGLKVERRQEVLPVLEVLRPQRTAVRPEGDQVRLRIISVAKEALHLIRGVVIELQIGQPDLQLDDPSLGPAKRGAREDKVLRGDGDGKVSIEVLVALQRLRPGGAELLQSLALPLDGRRRQVEEVGNLQQLGVVEFGQRGVHLQVVDIAHVKWERN